MFQPMSLFKDIDESNFAFSELQED